MGAMVGVWYGGHGQSRQITPYDIAKTQYQYVKLSTGAMVGVLCGGHGQGCQITPYDIAKTQYQYVKLSTGANEYGWCGLDQYDFAKTQYQYAKFSINHMNMPSLLAPSGALVVIMVYYISASHFFKFFNFFRF